MDSLSILQVFAYGFTLWFGLYLLAHGHASKGMIYAGLGLVAYALTLAANMWASVSSTPSNQDQFHLYISLLPAVFWYGAILHLSPNNPPLPQGQWTKQVQRALPYVLLGIALMVLIGQTILAGIPVGLMLFALVHLWLNRKIIPHKHSLAIVFTATLFFALSVGLLVLPVEILSDEVIVLAISLDLVFLGYGIAVLNAYDVGELILPDFLRSLTISAATALIFGGQVWLIDRIEAQSTDSMQLLLIGVVTAAIFVQVFSDHLQTLLDRIFLPAKAIQEERTRLRGITRALGRTNPSLNPITADEVEFQRLTRSAISNMGDLSRLASNPLINLPVITQRLAQNNRPDNTLERAAELKAVLTESIQRLKPRDKGDFGTSDEWRHYNALYFPYVVGLKPYSRRAQYHDLDEITQAALDWFRVYVPERTLYNWQTTAAKLIAEDLREIHLEQAKA